MRAAAAILLAVVVAGCGFRPLYATHGSGGAAGGALSMIALGAVRGPEEPRLALADALTDRLPDGGEDERFLLDIALREQRRAVAVTIDNNTRRFNYSLVASLRYTDTETGEVRTQNLQSIVSYGIVSSQYASLVGREDAVRRAAVDLARKIETDMALHAQGRAPKGSDQRIFEQDDRNDPLQQLEREAREAAIGTGEQ